MTHVQWLDIIKDILINISKPDELINIVKIELDDRTLMRTGVNGVRSDGTVIQYVRLPVESLLNILYFNLNKYDALVKYLKMSLRHEVGHLLSNEVIVGRHADDIMSAAQELTDLSNETRKEMELMYEDYKDSPTDEIWFKRYYSTPLEAMANNMVGLTYKDFYNSYLGLNCI